MIHVFYLALFYYFPSWISDFLLFSKSDRIKIFYFLLFSLYTEMFVKCCCG